MTAAFYLAAGVAVVATLMVVTRLNVVHALLYLVVSLLAVAVVFATLGAPFVAALEVIIYAGAIMVLFVFAIMILNVGAEAVGREREWLKPRVWIGPGLLAAVLLGELVTVMAGGEGSAGGGAVMPKAVGIALLGPYALAVELASLVLLAGLVGGYHLGRRVTTPDEEGA
jgi:NADH-quinone oxidoreductase subunit J